MFQFSWIKSGTAKVLKPIQLPVTSSVNEPVKNSDTIKTSGENIDAESSIAESIVNEPMENVETKSEPTIINPEPEETIEQVFPPEMQMHQQSAGMIAIQQQQQHPPPVNMVQVQAQMGYPVAGFPFYPPGFAPGLIPHPMSGMVPVAFMAPHGVTYGMAPLPMSQEQMMNVLQPGYNGSEFVLEQHVHNPPVSHNDSFVSSRSIEDLNSESKSPMTPRTHERRNKKRRPPDYYQKLAGQVEPSAGSTASISSDSGSSYKQDNSDISYRKSQSPINQLSSDAFDATSPPSVPQDTSNSEHWEDHQTIENVPVSNNYATNNFPPSNDNQGSGYVTSQNDATKLSSTEEWSDHIVNVCNTSFNSCNDNTMHSGDPAINKTVQDQECISADTLKTSIDINSDKKQQIDNTQQIGKDLTALNIDSVPVEQEFVTGTNSETESCRADVSVTSSGTSETTNHEIIPEYNIVKPEEHLNKVAHSKESIPVDSNKVSTTMKSDIAYAKNSEQLVGAVSEGESQKQVVDDTPVAPHSQIKHTLQQEAAPKKPNSWAGLFSGTTQARNATVIYVGSTGEL